MKWLQIARIAQPSDLMYGYYVKVNERWMMRLDLSVANGFAETGPSQ
jgi:hypothetical protein